MVRVSPVELIISLGGTNERVPLELAIPSPQPLLIVEGQQLDTKYEPRPTTYI